jgi:hypothetical protein
MATRVPSKSIKKAALAGNGGKIRETSWVRYAISKSYVETLPVPDNRRLQFMGQFRGFGWRFLRNLAIGQLVDFMGL